MEGGETGSDVCETAVRQISLGKCDLTILMIKVRPL